jgi:superfamily I DNA/RNA helicase
MAYYFRLPTILELTIPQQAALNDIGPISVSGGPGTGKSVVSLWRHIRTHDTSKKRSLLLTYTVTLATYLSSAAADENAKAGRFVRKTYWWIEHEQADFDEIIIDEAQDIVPSKYDIIKAHAPIISYGADDQQIIWPGKCTTQAQLEELFPDNSPYLLDENFRNSLQIMQFVKSALPGKLIPQSTLDMLEKDGRTGSKPIVLITNGNQSQKDKAIIDLIKQFTSPTHNIAILAPLKDEVNRIYEVIVGAGINCSKYVNDDSVLDIIENVHVTTFKSCKGTEFDTVIIPDFHLMKYYIANYRVVEENDYYVALTRVRRNLFLISVSDPTFINSSTYQKEQVK